MGNWDSIYQQYQKGGPAWATLSEGIDARFMDLLEKTDFTHKKALDIGCGTGKYLSYLENHGFEVSGIDSSPTAIKMTKTVLKNPAAILQADMYEFAYPENYFDLILSVSTLHHGTKSQVKNAIQKIHESLIANGKIFITLPNFDASTTWDTFKNHTQIEPGTFSPNEGPETGIPHSFFTKEEIQELFSEFTNVSLDLDEIGRWFIVAMK